MNHSIIITNVTNLTDARYFAAYGVDYLSFCIDKKDPCFVASEKIVEIMQWTEGPKLALQLGSDSLLDAILSPELMIVDQNLKGAFGCPTYSYYDNASHQLHDGIIIRCSDTSVIHTIQSFPQGQIIYLQPTMDVALFQELISVEGVTGFVLEGSEELKVGLKDFDLLDEILDLIYA